MFNSNQFSSQSVLTTEVQHAWYMVQLVRLNNQLSFKFYTSFFFVLAIFWLFPFLFGAPAAFFEANNISLPHWEAAVGMGEWPQTGASLAPERFGRVETQQGGANGTGGALLPSPHIGLKTAQREMRLTGAVVVFGMLIIGFSQSRWKRAGLDRTCSDLLT